MTRRDPLDLHPESMPLWLVMLLILVAIAAFGITGRWDYEDARRLECAQHGQSYDDKEDVCTATIPNGK